MAGNANSGKGRRPSTKLGRPSIVPPDIREAMYRLYVNSGYTAKECREWLLTQHGYNMKTSYVQSYCTAERKKREMAALEGDMAVHIMTLFRQLVHDAAQHHADANEIWHTMPDFEKRTMKGWKAKMDVVQNNQALMLKMHEVINAAKNATPEMDNAKESIAEKLKVSLEEDAKIAVDAK